MPEWCAPHTQNTLLSFWMEAGGPLSPVGASTIKAYPVFSDSFSALAPRMLIQELLALCKTSQLLVNIASNGGHIKT